MTKKGRRGSPKEGRLSIRAVLYYIRSSRYIDCIFRHTLSLSLSLSKLCSFVRLLASLVSLAVSLFFSFERIHRSQRWWARDRFVFDRERSSPEDRIDRLKSDRDVANLKVPRRVDSSNFEIRGTDRIDGIFLD